MQDLPLKRAGFGGVEDWVRRAELAGAAHMELVSGVVQLRPEDARTRRVPEALVPGRLWTRQR